MAEPGSTTQYHDVVTSHLREDTRILASVLANRRIYASPIHDIYLSIYSGLMDNSRLHADLVTCLVVFKDERLRILFKLWTDEIGGDRGAYIAEAVKRLQREGRGPHDLIRDSKQWTGLPFTMKDRAAFRLVGKELPKPPGEHQFRDPK